MRRTLLLLTILMLGLMGPVAASSGVSAQEADATPSTTEGRVPAPDECTVEPREIEPLRELLSPEGTPVVSTDASEPLPIPLGERARPAKARAVAEVTRTLIACLNAGDELRAAALFTDDGFLRFTRPVSAETALEQLEAEPVVQPEERRQRLIGVTNVADLPDGRLAALVVINDPLTFPPGSRTLLLIFTKRGGEWLIDDFYGFSIVVPANAMGTPTP